jgi:uncharacterized protein (DUF1015 family)
MVALSPIAAHLVRPVHANAVVSWAYDALRPDDRRRIADANPDSFFNVVRSAVDYPSSAVPDDLLATNAEALDRLLRLGRYEARRPSFYIYGLASPTHRQLAVIGDIPVTDHERGRVLAHELTRPSKEHELARHLDVLRVHSSPVGLGYRSSPAIDELVAAATAGPPILSFTTPDEVAQEIWPVADGLEAALADAFAAVEVAYIIDGHHRVAAAARFDPAGRFLAGLIPDDQLHLLPYHRVVAGPFEDAPEHLLAPLADRFEVAPLAGGVAPERPEDLTLYLRGRWWRLRLREPVAGRLAAALADDLVLPAAFGVVDARTDGRLEFVPGSDHLDQLARVADRQQGAALALCAPTVAQVFGEADAGRTLPPKSTWFEPKLHSGLFLVHR